MINIKHLDVFNVLEKWAPLSLAYEWDNVGLQVGSKVHNTKKIMVTLDVTDSVVDEAIENDVNLIIAHHPLFFSKLSNINFESFKGKVIKKLIQNNISVYAAHTNLDIANGGINDILSKALNLQSTQHLVDIPSENADYGIGKVGNLKETVTLSTLCEQVKTVFNMEQVRVIGNLSSSVKKVAVLGGSGEKFINDAIRHEADVLITGDVTYHHGQDGLEMGLAIIDAGHYIESNFIKPTKDYLVKNLEKSNLEIIESTTNTNPFQFI